MRAGYPGFRPVVRRRHRELGRVVTEPGVDGSHASSQWEVERERVEREQCGELVLAWRGVIVPFPVGMSLKEIQAIISDLDEDRPVRVMADGGLAHYEACGGTHRPRPGLRLHRVLDGAFTIEIVYRKAPGCPIARSLSPRIDRHHPSGPPPHLLNTIDALCVVFPADGAWVWGVHGARHYANYVAIWLAKHLAWIEARERGIGIEAAWSGSAVGHESDEVARLLGPGDLCRCGSRKLYRACCRPSDHAPEKERQEWRGVTLRLALTR
jgi:hypothetical protein